MQQLGIYIHIPFCARKCAYCDFYSVASDEKAEKYVGALIEQIKSYKRKAKSYIVDTVYIGGGTPTVIDAEYIRDIMAAVKETFRIEDGAEISIEANPGTLDGTKLATYRESGINRISIGLQSADNEELKTLSRIHTWEDFENSFLLARLEGFENINVDIMYALPSQTKKRLSDTLDAVIGLNPEHISFYGLKIEDNTPFANNPEVAAALPDEETQYRMYMDSAKKLEDNGYLQYEISNFAKEGKFCRHNMRYWKCGNYLGFGTAAASLFDENLFTYVKNIDAFIEDPLSPELIESEKQLSPSELATQFIMLGFRLAKGIESGEYALRFGRKLEEDYGEKLKPFIEKKLAVKTSAGYKLTRRGMLVSNYILSDILDFDR